MHTPLHNIYDHTVRFITVSSHPPHMIDLSCISRSVNYYFIPPFAPPQGILCKKPHYATDHHPVTLKDTLHHTYKTFDKKTACCAKLNFPKHSSSYLSIVDLSGDKTLPMTAAVLQMQNRRSASISKPQKQTKARKAQLPAIAPRYQLLSDPDAFDKTDPTVSASVNVPRTRLPPRSRFGCW